MAERVNHRDERPFSSLRTEEQDVTSNESRSRDEAPDEPIAPLTPEALAACLNNGAATEARQMLGNERHLDLSGQVVTQQGVDALAAVIQEGDFTKLSLAKTTLPDITNILNCFRRLPDSDPNLHLLELNLSGIQAQLTADHFTAIADILQENRLESLSLSGLNISQDQAAAILKASKTSLRRLDLSHNPLEIDKAFADALGANLALEALDLSHTQVDSHSLRHLIRALDTQRTHNLAIRQGGPGLRHLDLANCRICSSDHTDGLWAFIASLKRNTSLTHIDLNGNPLERSARWSGGRRCPRNAEGKSSPRVDSALRHHAMVL